MRLAPVFLLALGPAVAAGSGDVDATAASERIRAAMRAAVTGSPEIASRASRLGAEGADARSRAGAGAPTLSWQRDGIGSGLDRRANAVDYLRLTLPFEAPWKRAAGRRVLKASFHLQGLGESSGELEVAAAAGLGWLELAAAAETEELARARVERLKTALAIQTRRHELGEISGSERAQLELELIRDHAALRQAEAQRLAAEERLRIFTGAEGSPPEVGDLGRLVAETAAPAPVEPAAALATAPLLELASARAELAAVEAANERHVAWGRPELDLEWERVPGFGAMDGFDAAGVRLGLPLPWGREGRERIRASDHRAAAASAERDRLERELSARVEGALAAARAAEEALAAARATVDELATWDHSLGEQFRLGAVSYVVYLDGLSRLDEVRQTLIDTRYTLLASRLDLARLLGTDAYFPLPQTNQ